MSHKQLPKINSQGAIRTKDTADYGFIFDSNPEAWRRNPKKTYNHKQVQKAKRTPKPDVMSKSTEAWRKTNFVRL